MGNLKLGVDVGGTNTDAVVLDNRDNLLGAAKAPTTPDIGTGILEALDAVLAASGVDAGSITYAMVGTTHCTNAIIERKRLARLGVIRIGRPAATGVEPLYGWPDDLRRAIGGTWRIVRGGFEFDGREISPGGIEGAEISQVLQEMKRDDVESLAISCVFSPVNPDHESTVAAMAREVFGEDFPITLSHEVGSLGLLERENSAAFNAALVKVARAAAEGLHKALMERGIGARIFFAQNDGTVMSLAYATRYPILTIGAGCANSIRGAAFLTGLPDCIVVDVGGTSTDIGVLVRGFPRESASGVEIGGIRTNCRVPDIISIGLGGGSVIGRGDEEVVLGPQSVGYELTRRALSWGGDTMTLTDAAVALGRIQVADPRCDPSRVAHLEAELCRRGLARMVSTVEEGIDRIKTSHHRAPVVLVGGGSSLLPDSLKGASEVLRPPHYQYANAIGAAISEVSGEVETLWSAVRESRDEALRTATGKAVEKAIRAGATPGTVRVLEVEEIPLAYLPNNAVRVKVKAAGLLTAGR